MKEEAIWNCNDDFYASTSLRWLGWVSRGRSFFLFYDPGLAAATGSILVCFPISGSSASLCATTPGYFFFFVVVGLTNEAGHVSVGPCICERWRAGGRSGKWRRLGIRVLEFLQRSFGRLLFHSSRELNGIGPREMTDRPGRQFPSPVGCCGCNSQCILGRTWVFFLVDFCSFILSVERTRRWDVGMLSRKKCVRNDEVSLAAYGDLHAITETTNETVNENVPIMIPFEEDKKGEGWNALACAVFWDSL